jgi:predicted AAA+ superfamily ATPase
MDDAEHVLFPRFSAELVTTALKDTPVVLVTGPRQCGKATLVRDLVAGNREFITMDDDTVLAAARSDPTGLVRALDRTTIDEVQRVPDLLRAIKKSVDEDRRAGRFLLTGSANILTLPQVSESLAGRMEMTGSSRQTSHAGGMEAALTRRDLCRARAICNSLDLNHPLSTIR